MATNEQAGNLHAPSHATRPTTHRADGALFRRRRLWRDSLRRRFLAVADAAAVIASTLSLGIFSGTHLDQMLWATLLVPVWLAVAKLHGLYERDHRTLRHLTVDEIPAVLLWAMSGTAIAALLLALTPAGSIDLSIALQTSLVVTASAVLLRASTRLLWRRVTPRERTIIVGSGPLSAATRRKLELFPDIHVRIVGERDETNVHELFETPAAGADVERVIVASHTLDEELLAKLLVFCRRYGIKLSVVPPARGMFGTAVQLSHVADLPVVEYNTWDVSRSTLLLKRMADIAVSAAALVLLLPLFALVALAIRLDTGGPVIFTQRRGGLHGRPFEMRKFRTMVVDAEDRLRSLVRFETLGDPLFKLRNDPRVTRVGRILRRTSLDELPQLFNVLKGDMSLVGPRPEQLELIDRYRPEHRFRLSVKPGLTGPMQVFGRARLTFEERLAVEREYIENLSIRRDLRILALTIPTVLRGGGAY